MTTNQIEYWKLQESKRHNEAVEAEAQRHNVADEKISYTVGMYQGDAAHLSAGAHEQDADTNKNKLKLNIFQTGANLLFGGGDGLGSLLTAVGKIVAK